MSTGETFPQRKGPRQIGAIVLAAGASTRMGRPKQLLRIDGTPMIVRVVSAAMGSPLWPIVVVVGSSGVEVRAELARLPVLIAENSAWIEGMASSLRTGVATLQSFSRSLDGALVALCDQPAFTRSTIARLLQSAPSPLAARIVASRYQGRLGAPALFGRKYFDALSSLSGEAGARQVIATANEAGHVIPVDMPELAFDLDTPAYVDRLNQR